MDIQRSYAQAFSPDVNNTKDFGNIILKSDIEAKNTVWDNWMNGFSGWNKKLEDYLALKQPLKGVMINYSLGDSYQWIPEGCKYLMGLMDEKKIKYTTETFTGGHIVPSSGIKDYFVPFFNEKLTY